jgi:hypothetical protein
MQWIEFLRDHDHRWPSRAVTAFKKGQKVFAKREVAVAAVEAGAAKEIERPDDTDPARVPNRVETGALTGHPVRSQGEESDPMKPAGGAVPRNPHLVHGLPEEIREAFPDAEPLNPESDG